jgi:hypothetical protein
MISSLSSDSVSKTVSRKGAKVQRKARQDEAALTPFALFLCAFAGDAFVLLIHLPLKLHHYPNLRFELPSVFRAFRALL